MSWICFGDSAKGCLSTVRRALEPALDAEQILALSDDYAQGDISDVTDRAARADILMPWRGDPALDGAWAEEYQARHWQALEQLNEVDEAVVWYASGSAREQCGLRYVVARLQERHIPIWMAEVDEIPTEEIKEPDSALIRAETVCVITCSRALNFLLRLLPQPLLRRYAARLECRDRVERTSGGKVRYGLVGEMEPGAASYFYRHRRRLTEAEQAALLAEWKHAQAENTPLRAMVSGKVRSVPTDFYDQAILSCVPEEESVAAITVGRALAYIDREMGNRIGDMQIFARIRALGAAGRLVIVQSGANYREMTIRKIRD